MRELAYLNKGITISLIDKRHTKENGDFEGEVFHSKEGLKEFVKIAVNKYHVPIVLETPCEELTKKEQISMVRGWVN